MTHRSTSRLVRSLIKALGLKPAKSRRPRKRIASPEAQSAQKRLAGATKSLRLLSDTQRQAWRDWAKTQPILDPKTGSARTPHYDKAFTGLACRFLHLHAGETPPPPVPLDPPRFPFAGDPVFVTADPVPGGIEWRASGPTSPHVRVELLMQQMPSASQAPHPGRYRSQAFRAFDGGPYVLFLMRSGGPVVPAYRFVHAETGQAAPLVILPKIWVPRA